jgi:hypothetical protein
VPICGFCQKPIPAHDLVQVEESPFHNACTRPPLSELEYAEVMRKVIQEEVRNAIAHFVRMTRKPAGGE